MENLTQEQIKNLSEDIAFIKKAIEKNTSVIKQINFAYSLRSIMLIGSILIFIFCAIFEFLINHFGNFLSIPSYLKILLFFILFICVAFLGYLKNKNIVKSAQKISPNYSLFLLLKEYFSIRIYHYFIPSGFVILFLVLYTIFNGKFELIVPIISIGIGILYTSIDALLRINLFLFFGYWLMITGCLLLVFPSMPILLAICVTFGAGMFITSLLAYFIKEK